LVGAKFFPCLGIQISYILIFLTCSTQINDHRTPLIPSCDFRTNFHGHYMIVEELCIHRDITAIKRPGLDLENPIMNSRPLPKNF
jgi:hypothetical protein